MKKVSMLLFVMVVALQYAHADECGKLASAPPRELIEYLEQAAKTADPDCLTEAIGRIGDSRDPSGVPVLMKFLDFRRPQTEPEKAGVTSMRDKFPAVSALFSVGQAALPTLLDSLRAGGCTSMAKQNAIRTIMLIQGDAIQGVLAVRKAAREARVNVETTSLESCAQEAVNFCHPAMRERCRSALANDSHK